MGYWHAPRQFDGCVQCIAADGSVTTVGGALPGEAPHRPNDLCFAPDGSLLLTDSANWEDMQNLAPGRIVRIAPDGAVSLLAELPALPNGIAFGPDGRLYVAQSLSRKVLSYAWDGGPLGDPVPFVKLPGGMPDGMCFDEEGNLYVCGSIGNAVFVFTPGGELSATIETGEASQPTNCCLAGGVLYVTFALRGELVAVDVGADPLPLHRGTVTPSVTPA
jgi:gluconolactonase